MSLFHFACDQSGAGQPHVPDNLYDRDDAGAGTQAEDAADVRQEGRPGVMYLM